MPRSTIIRELSECLQTRLQSGLRAAVAGAREVSVYLVHPRELERADVPAACLYLWEVAPRPELRPKNSILETRETKPPRGYAREFLRWAPVWITCRYAVGVSGRRPEDEQDLVAAALQSLHDQPSVPVDLLPSLAQESELAEVVDRFPVAVAGDGELWRVLGLTHHVLLISIEATVPLPSERREPAARVFERRVELSPPSSSGEWPASQTSSPRERMVTSESDEARRPPSNGEALGEPPGGES